MAQVRSHPVNPHFQAPELTPNSPEITQNPRSPQHRDAEPHPPDRIRRARVLPPPATLPRSTPLTHLHLPLAARARDRILVRADRTTETSPRHRRTQIRGRRSRSQGSDGVDVGRRILVVGMRGARRAGGRCDVVVVPGDTGV